MYAVIFEAFPDEEGAADYLLIAKELRDILSEQEGFVSIERFASLSDEGKILSLSFWESEAAIANWRSVLVHREGQRVARQRLFGAYRIRVAEVVRDYGAGEREGAPADSNEALLGA